MMVDANISGLGNNGSGQNGLGNNGLGKNGRGKNGRTKNGLCRNGRAYTKFSSYVTCRGLVLLIRSGS